MDKITAHFVGEVTEIRASTRNPAFDVVRFLPAGERYYELFECRTGVVAPGWYAVKVLLKAVGYKDKEGRVNGFISATILVASSVPAQSASELQVA